ncbi:hypothetical protein [Clostridium ganghwense]|uniref:Uncharacterized protein n=1 Tax=Clostridium ganghwense TaxID=312089 RepID=A0ABT4CJW3_9CLOT|nr:hypothetical protein [Clostridium ganghwense]MCY6369336.1 hypothetical protein [Clostridium ganghwense]
MKRNYKIKKTISIKRFISEFGENFSEHTKKKLLDLEVRCVLTRKEDNYRLDLKHVEHTHYDCNSSTCQKEYAYGQLVVIDGTLYFSEVCTESTEVMQSPIVSTIYNSLNSEDMVCDSDINSKKIDDDNIDYVIDNILTVCPEVSQKYLDITQGMISRAERKKL